MLIVFLIFFFFYKTGFSKKKVVYILSNMYENYYNHYENKIKVII